MLHCPKSCNSNFSTGWDLRYVITPNKRWNPDSHDFQWKYKYMSYTSDSASGQASPSSSTAGPSSSTAGSSSSTTSSVKPTWWSGQGFAERFRERSLPYGQTEDSDPPVPLDATEYTFTVGEQPDKGVGDTLVGEYYLRIKQIS